MFSFQIHGGMSRSLRHRLVQGWPIAIVHVRNLNYCSRHVSFVGYTRRPVPVHTAVYLEVNTGGTGILPQSVSIVYVTRVDFNTM